MLKKIESKTALAGKAMEQLNESKKVAEQYKKILKEHKDGKYKNALKQSDSIIKNIDKLVDMMIGKKKTSSKVLQNPTPTSVTLLFTAEGYVNSLLQEPGKN
ncbi:MAG: hypothetical protein R2821_08990 [Flavobacteriaceae bacterium]